MKLATIAILLGVVEVTILATTAAHATRKNPIKAQQLNMQWLRT